MNEIDKAWAHRWDTVRQYVAILPSSCCLAFACSCCERLVPNYNAFALDEDWDEIDLASQILEQMWGWCLAPAIDPKEVESRLAALDALPFREDSPSIFLGMAQETIVALMKTMAYCKDHSVDHLVTVAARCCDSIENWVDISSAYDTSFGQADRELRAAVDLEENRATPGAPTSASPGEAWLEQHPMVIAEYQKQLTDLAVLRAAGVVTPRLLVLLRWSSRQQGIQPFSRGIRVLPKPREA